MVNTGRLVQLVSPTVVGAYVSRAALTREAVRLGGKFPVNGSELFGDKRRADGHVTVSDFLLGRFEVTIAEYRKYALATGALGRIVGDAKEIMGQSEDLTSGDPKWPMAWVSFQEAQDYHRWLSDQGLKDESGQLVIARLPRAAEWELAARGETGRIYP